MPEKVSPRLMKLLAAADLFVGLVPGFPGAHSQGMTLDEVNHHLQEVIAMLLEDGEP